MNEDIKKYNSELSPEDKKICDKLAEIITQNLDSSQSKIWHKHPVWFINGNPIVGYSKLKNSVQLLFWSGQSFDEENLQVEGTFKAAKVNYNSVDEINEKDLIRWLKKSEKIQWDYKNIVKRKGELIKLK